MKPKTTTTSSPSSSSAAVATGNPTASALTPNSFDGKNGRGESVLTGKGNVNTSAGNTTTINPISAEEEYERQFFLLRVFVLGTIGCVFSVLGLMFWIYFMYLWKTWDSGKRENMATATSAVEVPYSESSHGALSQKRNSSDGSLEANPYTNDDDTIEGTKYCINIYHFFL